MSTESRTANFDGDILFIRLTAPYTRLVSIEGFTDSVEGEDTINYFIKEFRWSRDNESYSDWAILINDNLQTLTLDPADDFWIQYKYTAVINETGHTLVFNAVALEIVTEEGILLDAPAAEYCDGEQNAMSNSLIIDDCCPAEVWNPYEYGNAVNIYEQLSCVVAKIFGLEVTYYRTDPAADTKDVVLKEWSLNHVVDKKCIKIQMADGELPSREMQFDAMGMNSMDMFEVHIVKSYYESTFGSGKRPREGDFLYFSVMDRVYEVNSVTLPDDPYYKSTYYRVMLTDWQKRASLIYDDEEYETSINDITRGIEEVFGEEIREEEEKVRIPKQYNTIYSGDGDYVRKEIDKNLMIREHKLRNNFTIISKFYYDLTSITKGNVATIYRYNGGISATDNRAFTFWIKPQFIGTSYNYVSILNVESDNGYPKFTTTTEHGYSIGDAVTLSGCGDYDGTHLVLATASLSFIINTTYTSASLNTARSKKHEECHFMTYSGGMYMSITDNAFIISIGEKDFVFNLENQDLILSNDNWYGCVINLSNEFNQLSLFIWEIETSTGVTSFNLNSTLTNIYKETITLTSNYEISSGHNWEILATNSFFTNFRLFKAPIEIEEQSLVLSRYVETDSHLSLIIDNAVPGLRLVKKANAR